MQASWKVSTVRLDAARLSRAAGGRKTLDWLQADNDAGQAELLVLHAQTDL